jgi:methyltransferase
VIPLLALVVFGAMVVEARRAARNEAVQRDRGGVEPPGDVFAIMRIVYPAVFLVMFAEGFWRGAPPPALWIAGAAILAASKFLKWWAIVSLGSSWTFRVIVVPGMPLVLKGPYRALRHPNYVAVAGELVGVAIADGARIAGPLGCAVFGWLLWRRVAVENRALAAAAR